MRLVLYTGKGGVGKTTTAAATAVRSAALGQRTLVLSADAAHSLGDVLDIRLGPVPRELAPNLHAAELDARSELERHWGSIREYLVALFRYQGIEETVSEERALLPGASKEEIDVRASGGELFVRVRDAQRRVALPDSLVGKPVEETRFERGRLEVVFAP